MDQTVARQTVRYVADLLSNNIEPLFYTYRGFVVLRLMAVPLLTLFVVFPPILLSRPGALRHRLPSVLEIV